MSSRRIVVCLELSPTQTFASALDWPGWCRAGRDERAALEALTSYAERYAPVAGRAGVRFPSTVAFDVIERVPGGPTTAFAAPECRRPFPQVTAEVERARVTPAAAGRLVGLVTAAWATFDEVAAASPARLRRGPRGGGRDRDQIIDHVIGAETAYARKLGVKLKQPAIDDIAAIEEQREAIAAVAGTASDGSSRVAQRLDHALRGPPDRLARARACLGDAGPSGEIAGPATRTRPASQANTTSCARSRPRRPAMAGVTWVLAMRGLKQVPGNSSLDSPAPPARLARAVGELFQIRGGALGSGRIGVSPTAG